MDSIRFYIDHQNDPKRNAKFRLRVSQGTGKNRVEVKAIYFEDIKKAERFKKHFREVLNAINTQHGDKNASD